MTRIPPTNLPSVEQRLNNIASAVFGAGDPEAARHVLAALDLHHLKFWHDTTVVTGLAHAIDETSTDDPDQWALLRDVAAALKAHRAPGGHPPKVLDFGCGVKADHRSVIESCGLEWWGLEVGDSKDPGTGPKLAQLAANPRVRLYDGSVIPFENESFDVVFSNQSLEHVHDCDLAICEIARILRPGGRLIGSVSHLEPYHGFSTFNYTPFGFHVLCSRHALRFERITPGFDALSYVTRCLLARLGQEGVDSMFTHFYAKPALNRLIDDLCRQMGRSVREANEMKISMCAQFRFVVGKIATR
jgi:SAM-dependent methyltransferase